METRKKMKCILNTFHIHFTKINRVFLHCTVLFRQFSVCSLFCQIIIIKWCWYHIVWWFELKIKRNKTFSVWKSKSLVNIFNSWQIFCTSESKQTKKRKKDDQAEIQKSGWRCDQKLLHCCSRFWMDEDILSGL